MRTQTPLHFALMPICFVVLAAPASAQTTLARTVVATGGGVTSSPTMSIHCTIGEPAVGRVVSTTMEIRAGFWHPPEGSGGPVCVPDCDANNELNIDDFICFQTLFALQDRGADCDQDGIFTIDDYICFQTFFAIGC